MGPEDLWDGWTWREFYQRVLWPFGGLLGWWQRNLRFYSGVLRVEASAGGIGVSALDAPLDDSFLASPAQPLPPLRLPKGFPPHKLPPLALRHRLRPHEVHPSSPLPTCHEREARSRMEARPPPT